MHSQWIPVPSPPSSPQKGPGDEAKHGCVHILFPSRVELRKLTSSGALGTAQLRESVLRPLSSNRPATSMGNQGRTTPNIDLRCMYMYYILYIAIHMCAMNTVLTLLDTELWTFRWQEKVFSQVSVCSMCIHPRSVH